jgi:hypothetical protein
MLSGPGKSMVGFAAVAGFMFNHHSPQISLLYLLVIFPFVMKRFRNQLRPRMILFSAFAFFLSASPFLYSALTYHDQLEPLSHGGRSLMAETWGHYWGINQEQHSSLSPIGLTRFLGVRVSQEFGIAALDDLTMAVSPFFAAAIGLFALGFGRRAWPHLLIGGILCVFATGTFGPVPRLLFPWFPGIAVFRQWFHFLPLAAFHFLIFFWIVVSEIDPAKIKRKGAGWFFALGWLLVCALYDASPFVWVANAVVAAVLFRPKTAGSILPWAIVAVHLAWAVQAGGKIRAEARPSVPDLNVLVRERFVDLISGETDMTRTELVRPRGLIYLPAFPPGVMVGGPESALRVIPAEEILIHHGHGIALDSRGFPKDELIRIPQFNDGHWKGALSPEESHFVAYRSTDGLIPIERTTRGWGWAVILAYLTVGIALFRTRRA